MAMTLEEQYQSAQLPAEVVFNVSKFKDIFQAEGIGKARCTDHTMEMKKEHSRVYVSDKGDELHVRTYGATLRMTITPSCYVPIGIAFVLKEGIAAPTKFDRLGLLNFDQLKLLPEKNTLAITDHFKEEVEGDADNEYEFSIIIQDGTTGKLGIIDPRIVHEN